MENPGRGSLLLTSMQHGRHSDTRAMIIRQVASSVSAETNRVSGNDLLLSPDKRLYGTYRANVTYIGIRASPVNAHATR
jgi:hypothetical protein